MARNIEAFKEKIEISVDNAKANHALHETEQRIDKLTSASKGFLGLFSKDAAEGIEKVEGLTGSIGQLSSGLGIAAGPAGILVGGIASLGTVATGAAVGLFKLADESAEMGNKVFEASEKTALSARTISAFAYAGKEVGLTIEDVSSGLAHFTVNMGVAADSSQKGSKLMAANFLKMGVDVKKGIEDPDQALATFVKHFAELPDEQSRVTAASEIFGKRFGTQLIAMFNEVGGNLDEFTKKLADMGLVIDEETARESHEFEKLKKDLESNFGAMTRTIGFQTIPAFETLFLTANEGLEANRAKWKEWGHDISVVILSVETELAGAARYISNFDWTNMVPLYGAYKGVRDFYQGMQEGGKKVVDQYQLLSNPPSADVDPALPNWMKKKNPFEGADSATQMGKLSKAAKEAADPLQKLRDITERLQIEQRFYGQHTERARVEQDFLRAGIEKLTPDLRAAADQYKRMALVIADVHDTEKLIADETERQAEQTQKETAAIGSFVSRQSSELDRLRGIEHSATEEANNFRVAFVRLGGALTEVDERMILLNAASIDFLKTYEKFGGQDIAIDMSPGFIDGWAVDFNKKLQDDFRAQVQEMGPPPKPIQHKWKDFFKNGLVDALSEVATMFPQQQVSKKRGLFSRILGIASPFLSFIPGIGPLLSMAASAAGGFLGGNPGAGISAIAGGLAPGGSISNLFRSNGGTPASGGAPDGSHAVGPGVRAIQ
jgi:hypothetical protein